MQALRSHRLLLAVAASYVVAVRGLLFVTGLSHWWHVRLVHEYLLVANALWAAGLATVAYANARLRATFTAERVGGALLVLTITPLMVDTYSSVKQALWWLVPFSWDTTIARTSMMVHGGRPAYAWIEPILTPDVLRALDTVYILWFFVMLATLIGCAWSAPSSRRTQALLAYVLAWIVIGTGVAALFASAGPCYFGYVVGGPDPYAIRVARLRAIGHALVAPALQADLWANLLAGEWRPYGGISAMPSMHVAIATWVALWLWPSRIGRSFGVLFVAVAQIASVALAWHYAVDGYVAIVLMIALWRGVGWLQGLDRRSRGTSPDDSALATESARRLTWSVYAEGPRDK